MDTHMHMDMWTCIDTHVLPYHSHLKQSGTITTLSQMVKETQVRIWLVQGHPEWRCEGHGDTSDTGGNTEKAGHWHSHLTRQVSELEKHMLRDVSQQRSPYDGQRHH